MKKIDRMLNNITMYRLMLYYLAGLVCVAMVLGFFGILPYHPVSLLLSTVLLIAVSAGANAVFSWFWKAHTNVESVYITALILALIITPPALKSFQWNTIFFLICAALLATASKYILAIGKKHIFNPAAFAVALTSLTIAQSASWWAGENLPMLAFVLIGGFLVVRKIQRTDLIISFFATAALSIALTGTAGENPLALIGKALARSPIFFFAFVMLTEPLTTPPTKPLRIAYGALVGILFAPAIHIGIIFSTPELALLAGNIFSYLISPKWKETLTLIEKIPLGKNAYEFAFSSNRPLRFLPGQYLEWTLSHKNPDSRGNRRYFTVASSPQEKLIKIGVKFYEKASTFKQSLLSMKKGDAISASQLAGDFTLPEDPSKKIACVAGGIGITPFISMLKTFLAAKQKRDIILFYSCKTPEEFSYNDVLQRAAQELGMQIVPVIGALSPQRIAKEAPDYEQRIFYISGPRTMVESFEESLSLMGVPRGKIKTDFFPGYA